MASTKRRKVGRPKGTGVKGHVPVLVAFRPDQVDQVRELAEERREPGRRLPFSEVVRDLVDRALGKR